MTTERDTERNRRRIKRQRDIAEHLNNTKRAMSEEEIAKRLQRAKRDRHLTIL
jgi:hypothetical protein